MQIKWPNDIVAVGGAGFRARRKIAGILAEASSGPDGVQHVVLGIGINLRPAAFPPELADRAERRSRPSSDAPVDAGAVLAQVLAALNRDAAASSSTAGPPPLVRALARRCRRRRTARAIEWDGPRGVRDGRHAPASPRTARCSRARRDGLARIIVR